MALKRPKPPDLSVKDVRLIDELVSKSLSINPQMGGGQDTQGYLNKIRNEAVQAEREGKPRTPTSTSSPQNKSVLRMQTIRFLIEQREQDVNEGLEQFAIRKKELESERQTFLRQMSDDIVNAVSVVIASGASDQECAKAMAPSRALFKKLEITDLQIIQQAKRRS